MAESPRMLFEIHYMSHVALKLFVILMGYLDWMRWYIGDAGDIAGTAVKITILVISPWHNCHHTWILVPTVDVGSCSTQLSVFLLLLKNIYGLTIASGWSKLLRYRNICACMTWWLTKKCWQETAKRSLSLSKCPQHSLWYLLPMWIVT